MRLLVTGSEGFVGKGLCERLKKNHDVFGFDKAANPVQDVTDYPTLLNYALSVNPDWILHLAAQAQIPVGEKDPLMDAKINVLGTLNAMRVAKELGCNIVYHSSGAVYGDQPQQPVFEDIPLNPQSFYGVSKACGELYAVHFARHRGVPVWITRFSSVVVKNRREGPVYFFCKSALEKGVITLTGDGLQSRDITHIDDVHQGVELILSGKVPQGRVYNLASGKEITMLDLAKRVFELIGKEPKIVFTAPRSGDIARNFYHVARLETYGYAPEKDLDDCIRMTLEYVREELGARR